MNDKEKMFFVGFQEGLNIGVEKIKRVLNLFNGYPQNKMLVLDIKESLEQEIKLLKDTKEANPNPQIQEKESNISYLSL